MFLSRLWIDLGNDATHPRPGRLWIKNPYTVHQRLCMAFPSDPRRATDPKFLLPFDPDDFKAHVHTPRSQETGFLFRVDALIGNTALILVRSAVEPDWGYAFQNSPHLLAKAPDVRADSAPVLETGTRFRFRLRANPVASDGTRRETSTPEKLSGGHRGRSIKTPLRDETSQLAWIKRKLEATGAALLTVTIDSEGIKNLSSPQIRESSKRIQLLTVLYEGVLVVKDPTLLTEGYRSGIGRGKAFGCGLLSIAPL